MNQLVEQETRLAITQDKAALRQTQLGKAEKIATEMFGEDSRQWVEGLDERELKGLIDVGEEAMRAGIVPDLPKSQNK